MDEPVSRSTSDRVRESVLDALRRVGPPDSGFQATSLAPRTGDEPTGEAS